jgi:hypothetical protein
MCAGSPTAGTWSSSRWRPDNEFETDTRSNLPQRLKETTHFSEPSECGMLLEGAPSASVVFPATNSFAAPTGRLSLTWYPGRDMRQRTMTTAQIQRYGTRTLRITKAATISTITRRDHSTSGEFCMVSPNSWTVTCGCGVQNSPTTRHLQHGGPLDVSFRCNGTGNLSNW